LVYAINIAPSIATEEVNLVSPKQILKSSKYFGQYGKITKLVVNKKNPHSLNADRRVASNE
jgi:CCR4-NOT transcription complex subunit 4